jgi:hypothetical protein
VAAYSKQGKSCRAQAQTRTLKKGNIFGHEELNNLYSSPNIVWVINSSRMRWAENVAFMGRREVNAGILWRNLKERDHLEVPGVDKMIILRWNIRKLDVGVWSGSICLWIRTRKRKRKLNFRCNK